MRYPAKAGSQAVDRDLGHEGVPDHSWGCPASSASRGPALSLLLKFILKARLGRQSKGRDTKGQRSLSLAAHGAEGSA
jgi:hypothetical protein